MTQRSPKNQRNQNRADTITGSSKRSAARAKPAREAAQSVYISSSSSKGRKTNPITETKEEKKERKARERDERDNVMVISNLLLRDDETYKKRHRIWLIALILGVVLTLISWPTMMMSQNGSNATLGFISFASIILAYVCIIGALIYDLVRVRPLRNKYQSMAEGMSKRRRMQVIEDARRAEAEAHRAKEMKKAMRRNKKQKNANE